ncbi:MAG: NADH-quinone oxidoreductase subunit M, partial [Bacteroidales bacterium]
MSILSLFVLIPLLMMGGLLLAKNMNQIRTVATLGSALQLIAAIGLVVLFCKERGAGNTAEMLFMADHVWFVPLNIHYAVGVDGISVAMILLSAIIVFAGVFASWK